MFKTAGGRCSERMKVRRATLADLETLVRRRRAMFVDMGHADERKLRAADVAYRAWARRLMPRGELVAFVAEIPGGSEGTATRRGKNGDIIASGCLWMQPIQPRPGYVDGIEPYLLGMHTDDAHRGKGAATRIVKAAMAFAKKEGYPRMSLHATVMGRPIYAKLGWTDSNEMVFHLGKKADTLGGAPPQTPP